MSEFSITALLPVFLLSFLLPGFFLTAVLIRKGQVDFLAFVLYTVVFGLFSQLINALGMALTVGLDIDPKTRAILVAAVFLLIIIFLGLFYAKENWIKQLAKIHFSAYDLAAILLILIMLIFLASQINNSDLPYFNPATDQYFWLAWAESFIDQPLTNSHQLLQLDAHKAGFFLLLTSFIPFLPKTLVAYQQFMISWTFFYYALWAVAIAQLGRVLLPIPALGLLAPLSLFIFHWGNYYLISTDVVPQNIAIPLFLIGFLFIHEYHLWQTENKKRWLFILIFLLVFYLIHLATLIIFLLVLGTAELIRYFGRLILTRFSRNPLAVKLRLEKFIGPRGIVNVLAAVALPLAITAVIRYGLYFTGLLPKKDPSRISYYEAYIKPINLWSQPYLPEIASQIIWLALAGLVLALIYMAFSTRKSAALFPFAISLVVNIIFLKTPLAAYHAFFASWQPFRYLFFINIGLAIFSLFAVAFILLGIKEYVSKNISMILAGLIVLLLTSTFLIAIEKQQLYIFLDMIWGRDKGVFAAETTKKIKELLAADQMIFKEGDGDVLIIGAIDAPYAQWAFSPQPVFVASKCGKDYYHCVAINRIGQQSALVSQLNLGLLVLEKKEKLAEKQLARLFISSYESANFKFYYDRRKTEK